jgi:signal transduction histidine kinase
MSKLLTLILFILFLKGTCQELNNAQTQLKNIIVIGDKYFDQVNIDSSLYYYAQALILAEITHDSTNLTTLTRKKGQIYELQGNYSAALTQYLTAISYSNQTSQVYERGLCYLGLSNVNFRTANTEMALADGIEAATIFKTLNDTANYVRGLELIAQVYLSSEKYHDAQNISNLMFELASVSKDSILLARALSFKGAVNSFLENYNESLEFHRKAIELNKKTGNKILEAINIGNMGEIYMKKGDSRKALQLLHQALEIEQKLGFKSGIIYLYYTLGDTYSKINNETEALKYFNKSLALIDEIGEEREKPMVYSLLADYYEKNNNYLKANTYNKKLIAAKDSLNKLATMLKVEELKAKYEIETKEQQYKSLMVDKKIQEQELASTKKFIKLQLLVLILVLAGFISSISFTLYFVKSRKTLKQTNKTKDLLFSIIGHDLRGAMGNIKQIAGFIQSKDFHDREKFIAMLEQPTTASYNLLEDLLAWSRSISNNLNFNPELVNLHTILFTSMEMVRSAAQEKNITLQSKIPELLEVYADKNLVSALFRNLMSNAIKYTPNGGLVSVNYQFADGRTKISITDTGIGINSQQIKKIIDPSEFYTSYCTQNEKGSGLGLIICQEFAKVHGGTLYIESKPGQGSMFSFTLPLTKNSTTINKNIIRNSLNPIFRSYPLNSV